MNERNELLAAIRSDPGDNTLRLAYADWLDEQGNKADAERAEFIRLQIKRESHGPPHLYLGQLFQHEFEVSPNGTIVKFEIDYSETHSQKIGDRVDFDLFRHEFGPPTLSRYFGYRIVKAEHGFDGTTRITAARDEYSKPWPQAEVVSLNDRILEIFLPNWRFWLDGFPASEGCVPCIDRTDKREFPLRAPQPGDLVVPPTLRPARNLPSPLTIYSFRGGFLSAIHGEWREIGSRLLVLIRHLPIHSVYLPTVPLIDLYQIDFPVKIIACLQNTPRLGEISLPGMPTSNGEFESVVRRVLKKAFPTVVNWVFQVDPVLDDANGDE